MGQIQDVTINPPAQGQGGKLVLAAATVGRVEVDRDCYMVITPDAATFMCRGTVATNAVVDVDCYLSANISYRVGPMKDGEYLCFISTPGGNVFYTFGA